MGQNPFYGPNAVMCRLANKIYILNKNILKISKFYSENLYITGEMRCH
jgi:hypothetical protein